MPALTDKEKKKRYTDRWRSRGWRQVSFWLPESEIDKIQDIVKEIKNEHLRRDAESGEDTNGDDG